MIIVGLGNPGEEYEGTRHNAGREAVMLFAKKNSFPAFEFDKKSNALISEKKLGKNKITLVLPETFMNKSGLSVGKFVKLSKSKGRLSVELFVVHDDLDIPLGRAKMSFNKSSGGHKGVESIMRAVKSESFWRIRIGISKAGPKGSVKKPQGEDLINNFIVSEFKSAEADELKKVLKKIVWCIEIASTESGEKAMGMLNSSL